MRRSAARVHASHSSATRGLTPSARPLASAPTQLVAARAVAEPGPVSPGVRFDFSRLPLTPSVQRVGCAGGSCSCSSCEEKKEEVARAAQPGVSGAAPSQEVSAHVACGLGSGHPLESSARAFFEPRFGHDLGGVRIHTDAKAAASARALQARAYTVGSDIAFQEGAYSPATHAGRRLLAHELTHVLQQTGGRSTSGARLARFATGGLSVSSPGDASEREAESMADAVMADGATREPGRHGLGVARDFSPAPASKYTVPSPPAPPTPPTTTTSDVPPTQSGTPINKNGLVAAEEGVNLRASPDTGSAPLERLPQNTRMFVSREQSGGWYFVMLVDGRFGYVAKSHVTVDLPDPEAKLYRIASGETALDIVQRFYKSDATKWGQDERFFVNVLVFVNAERGRKGIFKPDPEGDWDTTQTHAGSQIWIPGVEFAKALKGQVSSGSITYEAYQKVKNVITAIGEFLAGSIAFVAGLLHGVLESLWDTLVGLVDLAKLAGKLVWSLVTGNLLSDIRGFFSDLSKLDFKQLVAAGLDALDKKWNDPSILKRWHFRGWITGYALAEIVMLFFSGGALTALKGAGKAGKFAQFLAKMPRAAKFLEKAGEAAKGLKEAEALRKGMKALTTARDWAVRVLKVPRHILQNLSAEALERLKRLPQWAIERFSELSDVAKARVLGCASPCKVDLGAIQKYLAELAAKGATGAKKLTTPEGVLAALPTDLNIGKIKQYLDEYPALMELIRKADLTDLDLAKMADFLTAADKTNPKTAYQTFTRYLTLVVPSKTGGDISAFNTIVEAVVKADPRQGSALKGPMFEAFARTHLPEFANKAFTRETFNVPGGKRRTADRFFADNGELWEVKHQLTDKVPPGQVDDYLSFLGTTGNTTKAEVKTLHYLFPSQAAAELNSALKARGIIVWYVKQPNVLTKL
ncbi:eCIS core domain-containing protein [Myxococcus fulvus]|uniref:eCIS core domain-containing protein n=1 Tax=Myxococcus fulvus TaxID=33 RepID=UPI003B9B5E4D